MKQSFIIALDCQSSHRLKLSTLRYVKLHTRYHPGHVVPPDAMGLEYDYIPKSKDEILIIVTRNPFHTPIENIKRAIERELVKLRIFPFDYIF